MTNSKERIADPSTNKATRTALLAILLHTAGQTGLTKEEIFKCIPFYGQNPQKALYRDIETLADQTVENLPRPDDENLAELCEQQRQLGKLALIYDRSAGTFGLAQSTLQFDISEEEARSFVALKNGFTPGTPYADAVQQMLQRWEWLFSEKSRLLVKKKQERLARPVLLPLAPVNDYSQHAGVILQLDSALEEGVYISFAYTSPAKSPDDEPIFYQHIEPYELAYRDGHWYFTAYMPEMDTFLDYRVDRIHPNSVQREHGRFRPGSRKRPGIKIRYWVSPALVHHGTVSTRLQDQKVDLLEDGQGAIVEGYASSTWWAMRLLLGYGKQAKALEPEELVKMMCDNAQEMAQLYREEA